MWIMNQTWREKEVETGKRGNPKSRPIANSGEHDKGALCYFKNLVVPTEKERIDKRSMRDACHTSRRLCVVDSRLSMSHGLIRRLPAL
jgi:hypothetical protein